MVSSFSHSFKNCVLQAWLIWRNRFDERVASKAKVLQAQQHARFGVLRRCVLAWKAFVLNRQNIRSHYGKLPCSLSRCIRCSGFSMRRIAEILLAISDQFY